MGRKKKRFIDKKTAVSFNLVHRSQNDPLLDELGESQMVLASSKNDDQSVVDHTSEQRKYGINYNDDYDYLQHLKEPGTVFPVSMDSLKDKQKLPLNLPQDLFGTEVSVDGLKRIVPISGPQPDWDPEISEALDRLEDEGENDCNESLEDDFVLQASGGELLLPVYYDEQELEEQENERSDSSQWWIHRGNFKVSDQLLNEEEYDLSPHLEEELEEKKSFRFTEYSMTSSVVPRSEGLSNLDEMFEEFMIGYDDNRIGPLEEQRNETLNSENEDGGEFENVILTAAVEEFLHKYDQTTTNVTATSIAKCQGSNVCNVTDGGNEGERYDSTDGSCDENCVDEDVDKEEREVVPLDQQQKWDCESVLSTYSNLFNHPTLIKDPPHRNFKVKVHQNSSESDQSSCCNLKTRYELNDADSSESRYHLQHVRPRNETKEEHKLRKQAVKQERREHRQAKKALKLAFKKEQLRQEKELISNPVFSKINN